MYHLNLRAGQLPSSASVILDKFNNKIRWINWRFSCGGVLPIQQGLAMQVVAPWQRGISAAPVGHHNPRHYWAHTGAMPCMVVRCRTEGGAPPPVWISSSKSTTQSPSVAVWPARTFISRWCDGRVGSLPGHPHTPHISPHLRPPPRSIIENSPRWMRVRRQTAVRNNIHHLSQHLSPPVSLILSPQGLISQST